MLKINENKINEFAIRLNSFLSSYPSKYDEHESYIPTSVSDEEFLRFTLFMVAIDHRAGVHFKGYVDGKYFFGTKLRWYLGLRKFRNDPSFFSPENMRLLDVKQLENWLSVEDNHTRVTVKDPQIRTFLLRETAEKILRLYDDSVTRLVDASESKLFTSDPLHNYGGLIERLKAFRAYEDPVEKKSFLFVKYLMKKGLFIPGDQGNLHLPVDNHLSKIAVRIGLTKTIDETATSLFLWQRPCTDVEDTMIRLVTRHAYKLILESSSVNACILDDALWNFGRDLCKSDMPLCSRCDLAPICDSSKSSTTDRLKEQMFLDTWYY